MISIRISKYYSIFKNIRTIHVSGLYCQDPDTKKLYPVNSTWRSETFCGNYTCKLRKRNLTETEYVPITINITSHQLNEGYGITSNDDSNDMSVSPSENSFVLKKMDPEKQPVFHRDFDDKINDLKEELKNNKSEQADRYLTESEIEKITGILHTIKKSDLEAIVDIYNIAQEIHKELDMAEAEKIVNDTMNSIKNDEIKNKIPSQAQKDSISYWYEPLQHTSKNKPVDLKTQGTNVVQTAYPYPNGDAYYKRPDQERAFQKLSHYYPASNFHRMLSYLHNPYNSKQISRQETKPCRNDNKNLANTVVPVWYNPYSNNNAESYKKPYDTQPIFLPYPFSYVHHNLTHPASYYYTNYPWAQLNAYNRNKQYLQPYYGTYATQEPRTAIIANPEELEGNYDEQIDVRIDDVKPVNKELPEWQTEPLSAKILDEVKANMLEKSKILKPLSLRKTLKLEKVGKVIKLDELTRSKRGVLDVIDPRHHDGISEEVYETYIEKTTCVSSLEPGYFSVGNETEPYPACCPRRINS
ncbi:uncharacterized protein LOC124539214 [Vanessa cardui]|uniref:uncharacterized protein LOC124539214 n=1 Tax=Vanessa cardui TaxID=171605 RepID=UPI001F1484F5|nr:uncharacterized protein LOC124539214 [Vanessa cardui]